MRQPEQLPGHRQGATVEQLRLQGTARRAAGHTGGRCRVPGHPTQAPRRIDARPGLHIHLRTRHHVNVIAIDENQHFCQLRIADQHVDGVVDGKAQCAFGDPWQQAAACRVISRQAGEQAGGDIGGVSQGIGNRVVPQLLGHQRPGHIVHAQATLGFGDRQGGQALGGDLVTQVR
ncbi:hypothetical protein D3C87_1589100 [compost metagenome]